MKKTIFMLLFLSISIFSLAQNKYSAQVFTEGGVTAESQYEFHYDYGFGFTLSRNFGERFSVGLGAAGKKILNPESYYIPVHVQMQSRILKTNFSPVISLSAGYSFLIPHVDDAEPLINSQKLNYRWQDYTNPDLVDENGDFIFQTEKEYGDYLYYEKGVNDIYVTIEDEETGETHTVFSYDNLSKYLRSFRSGDARYFEDGVSFTQHGCFFNVGLGFDYKISDYKIGFLAEAGLYQVFDGVILKNEKNEYEYFKELDYFCKEVEYEVNGKTITSYERGECTAMTKGRLFGSFYPKVSFRFYVAF